MNGAPLVLAAAVMGLAGAPHCAAMCAAPCAAAVRACGRSPATAPAFQLGRVLGYTSAGAVAASGASLLHDGLAAVPVLRPLWMLLHLAALALGLAMLVRGRTPVLAGWPAAGTAGALPVGWHALRGPARGVVAGSAWIAWPCALLQSALLLATLGDNAWQGAASMAAFAVTSSPGLIAAPWLFSRLGAGRPQWRRATWPVRTAGLMVALGSLWGLWHGASAGVAPWCAG